MFKSIKELFLALKPDQRFRFYKLQIVVVIAAFGEVVGLASVAPFMSIVSNMSLLEDKESMFSKLYEVSPFTNELDFIFWLGVFVIILLMLTTLVSIISTTMQAMFAAEVGTENADRLFNFYIKQNWLYHTSESSAQMIKKIANEAVRVTDLVILPIVLMISKLVLLSFIVIGLIIYDPIVTISSLVVFCLCYFTVFTISKKQLSKNGNVLSLVSTTRFKLMNEAFGGIKDILLTNKQGYYVDKFHESGKKFSKARGNNHILWQVPKFFMEFITFGSLITIVLYILSSGMEDFINLIPLLSVYVLAVFKILPAFQQLYASIGQIKGNISAFYSIREDLLNSTIEIQDPLINPKKLRLDQNLIIQNLSFQYPSSKKKSIEDLTMCIKAKSVVGIVGASGSGKSTLIDILLGLLEPSKGEIKIDSIRLNKDNIKNWQNNLAFVPQDIYLSENSLAENIALGIPKEEIKTNEIFDALKLAQLEEFQKTLPKGIDSSIGERGIQISGGQKQRIGIARALYRNSDVLIFDEATSALDGLTEKMIMDSINLLKGKKTIILVAHRLKNIKECDNIFFLDDGQLIAEGKFDDLVKNNLSFRELSRNA